MLSEDKRDLSLDCAALGGSLACLPPVSRARRACTMMDGMGTRDLFHAALV